MTTAAGEKPISENSLSGLCADDESTSASGGADGDGPSDAPVLEPAVQDLEPSPRNSRPQISAIRIQNFKKIRDTRIELGPITYLVGGNNSGKSSVLQAIHTAVSCAQASVEPWPASHCRGQSAIFAGGGLFTSRTRDAI